MNFTKSSNPALREKTFARDYNPAASDVMTVSGTINKTALLLLLVIAAAVYTWKKFYTAALVNPETAFSAIAPWMLVGGVGGFITAMVTVFRPKSSNISAPIYAVLEGLLLGGLSASLEVQYSGIVVRAVALTLSVFAVMLFLYRTGVIKVTRKFMLGIVAATAGIALVYLVSFIASLFGVHFGFLYGNSNLSIGISLFVVAIAALNLVLDFSFIERSASAGAPKYMEWYGAFGLMVTLVWLYIEILRLLSKIASRR